MKFIDFKNPGGPDVLHLAETSSPTPQEGEVLIEVVAAGVNRPDCFQRRGSYPPPAGASPILGLEVAGRIVACGPGVQRYKVGDEVCALLAGGGYAEFAVAPEGQCLPKPQNLTFIEAAALPETFFTVWTNVFEDGRLRAGEKILIHGGSGGIGTTAIQMAHAQGAIVYTTVGKHEAIPVCKQAGANEVILYKEEDFVARIKQLTSQQGVDLILDMVGGDYFARNLECLSPQGRLVQIATLQGPKVELDLRLLMLKRLSVMGSTLRSRTVLEKSRIAHELEKHFWPLLENGRLKPSIFKTFSLEQAAQAHELMESRGHVGKIVLTVKRDSHETTHTR